MTLDETIKCTEELAELFEDQARVYKEQGDTMGYWSYEECAKKRRQLAEWLRKLKAYESDDEICKYCTHTHDANYCNMCKHNTIFVDYFDLEGNTDE